MLNERSASSSPRQRREVPTHLQNCDLQTLVLEEALGLGQEDGRVCGEAASVSLGETPRSLELAHGKASRLLKQKE